MNFNKRITLVKDVMRCDRCGKEGATVHIVKVIKGKKVESWLCNECAQKDQELNMFKAFNANEISVDDMINELAGYLTDINFVPYDASKIVCKNCGTTCEEYKKTGIVGCPECYRYFNGDIEYDLEKNQGAKVHIGKIPERACKALIIKRKLETLKEELNKLVKVEEYEKAAEVRDKIKTLQEKMN